MNAIRRGQKRLRYLQPDTETDQDKDEDAKGAEVEGEEEEKLRRLPQRRKKLDVGSPAKVVAKMTPSKPPPESFEEARWRRTPPFWPRDRDKERSKGGTDDDRRQEDRNKG